MFELFEATTPEQIVNFCAFSGSYPLTPEMPSLRQADAHWVAIMRGNVVARCSLWWTAAPPYPLGYDSALIEPGGGKLGLIGHYAATDEQAALGLIEQACAQLAAHGCTLAIGPLDGSTFRHYRLLTERSITGRRYPPFFLEPDNPDAWPAQFVSAGFQPLASYFSAHGELPATDPRLATLAQRVADHNITIRSVDLAHFDAELQQIYQIVVQSFANNFLYTPIDAAEFTAQYALVRPFVQPDLVLIAERAGEAVGFLFALPDLTQAQRGEAIDTVVIKTMGVVPALAGIGLGGLLAARGQTAAYQLGYRYAIHALMFEDNVSRKISERYAQMMRRYTLFAKKL